MILTKNKVNYMSEPQSLVKSGKIVTQYAYKAQNLQSSNGYSREKSLPKQRVKSVTKKNNKSKYLQKDPEKTNFSEQCQNTIIDATTKIQTESKLFDMFSTHGKGGIIKIIGEPVFPLKPTIEYLYLQYANCEVSIKSVTEEVSKLNKSPKSPSKRKEEKENKHSEELLNPLTVTVEAICTQNGKQKKEFKHKFCIKNDKIISLEISV